MMILTANNTHLMTLNTTSFYTILAVSVLGMVALLFTSYRTVVGYFLAGMAYWLVVEGLAWGLMASFPLDSLHGYVIAVGLTFVPILWLLNWVENRQKSLSVADISLRHFFSRTWALTQYKSLNTANRPTLLVAGQRPFLIEQDTDFSQHFIRHSPVFDYE